MVDLAAPLNGADAPPARVDATIPTPYEHGLFSVARILDVVDAHQNEGVHATPYTCEPATGFVRSCDDEEQATKSLGRNVNEDTAASPYTLYGYHECSSIGYSLTEAQQLARQNLLLGEERGAEAELWSAALGSITSLSGGINGGGVTDVGAGVAVSVVAGVAALEDWLGQNYGGVGMLHMPRGLAISLSHAYIIDFNRPDPKRLTTVLGTRVAAGGGYDGTGPVGAPARDPGAGKAWIFASGDVVLRRSAPFDTPPGSQTAAILDRDLNDMTALSERIYSNWIDGCGVAAVRVTIDSCGC